MKRPYKGRQNNANKCHNKGIYQSDVKNAKIGGFRGVVNNIVA
jgi:hypothetical protein